MASSTLRRLWIYYTNNFRRTHKVLAALAVVGIFYLMLASRHSDDGIGKSDYGVARYKTESEDDKMDSNAVRRILDSMVDTRPHQCRDHAYEFTRLVTGEKVSIVVAFHGAVFYDLKLALTAVVEHTPYDLYQEIVVLDDGTPSERIRRQVSAFLHDPKFNKVKFYRSESYDGQSASWSRASAAATGSILVFVDSRTVVNHGWLQPLLARLLDAPTAIVVPHADNLLDDGRMLWTDDNLVNVFTWSLSTVYYESAGGGDGDGDADDAIDTPVARGDALAVRRSFLDAIGGFDDELKPDAGGGEHLELSLRAWLCGGVVRVVTCSRVAVRNSLRRRRVADEFNFRHIAELWFGEYRTVVYRQGGVDGSLSSADRRSVAVRRERLARLTSSRCQSFGWYLANVASVVIAPTDDARHFGKLGAVTGYCVHVDESGAVTMRLCREHVYEPEAIFEMGGGGAIYRADRCLEPEDDDAISASQCNARIADQRWAFRDGRLVLASRPGLCLTHVTRREADPDLFHYARLEPCSRVEGETTRKQKWRFLKY